MPACPPLFSHVRHALFLAALVLAASGSGLARPVTVPATPAAASARPISFPVRPIRLIVPFPAGGVPDAVARLLAERLAVRLGVPVDVDNRPGAGGTTAGDVVAKASSDGHTLLFHQATMLIQPGLEPVPYDVVRDFTPVARVATMPLFLVIDARLPMRTPQQWLAAVNASPGSYSYGSGQAGSPRTSMPNTLCMVCQTGCRWLRPRARRRWCRRCWQGASALASARLLPSRPRSRAAICACSA